MTRIGTTVGSIRLDGLLGSGGMGEVYLGFDLRLERPVAVKTMRAEDRLSAESKARFRREARLLSKLGHPGICQVHDLIETPDADFLVLEYVPGKTLRQAAADGLTHERKLAIAEQVARALAAAHEARVVHRDLKADNVMVTAQGEVKILDFGVARLADEVAEEPANHEPLVLPVAALAAGPGEPTRAELPLPPGPDEPLTRAGVVMGTLSGMSPEQARGQRVDATSDLYSLGILLHQLFTGAAAYEPHVRQAELLAMVAQARTRPLTGLDPELARLVADLENLDPRRRPSAGETAERLRWIRDAPRRARRRRLRLAATAVSFVVLLAMLAVVSRFALVASRASAEAERRRAQAEDLIDFMLGDLRPKLAELGRLELLDAVGERALAYFETLPEGELTAGELAKRTHAMAQVGEVRRAQGDLPAALGAFQRAEAIARRVAAARPADLELQLAWLATLEWLGQAWWDQGRLPAAEEAWRRALTLAEEQVRRHPDSLPALGTLAASQHNLATLLDARGELEPALDLFRESLDSSRRVVAQDPDDLAPRGLLGGTLAYASSVLERQGRIAEAREWRREQLAVFDERARRRPVDVTLRMEAATARGFLAGLLARFGEPAEARRLYEEGLVTVGELAAADPANTELQRWLGAFRGALGPLLHALGERERGRQEVRAALAIFEELVRRDGSNADWRLQRALARSRLGAVLADVDPPAARHAARQGAAELAALLAEGESDTLRGHLATALLELGRHEQAAGDAAAARRACEQAVATLAPCSRPLTDWRLLAPWSEAQAALGRQSEAAAATAALHEMGYRDPRGGGTAPPAP